MTPDADIVTLWTSLVTTARRLTEEVEAALKSAGLPQLAWYDALLELEKAGPEGLRPYQLKDRLLLPQYGTSRLLDRLAKAGLIARVPCEGDGRGQLVRVTEAGEALRREMWPVYAEVLEQRLGARISPAKARDLALELRRLGT